MADSIPSQIIPGMSITWTVSNSDYPASDGWKIYYILTNKDDRYPFESDADGDDHVLEPDTTAWSTSGKFTVLSYFQLNGAGSKYQHKTETVTVQKGLLEGNVDSRSDARKCLDAINEALISVSNKTRSEYSIGDRAIKFMSLKELRDHKSYYEQIVFAEEEKERRANGKPSRRTILATFDRN